MADEANAFHRIASITLGVADLKRSRAFYDALGLVADPASAEDYAIYRLGDLALSLFPFDRLAADAGVNAARQGFDGITFAHDYPSPEAVDAAVAHALAAGATLTRPAQTVFWGGYSAFIADPDGHLFELVFNPFA